MTDIRRAANFNSAVMISPSFEKEILDLLQAKNPEAELRHLLLKMPEKDAKSLLELLKTDQSIPADMLQKLEAFLFNQAQALQPETGPAM